MEIVAFLAVAAFIIFLVIFAVMNNAKETERKTKALIHQHGETLLRKKLQTVYKDDYGNFIHDNWHREVLYFINNTIRPTLTKSENQTTSDLLIHKWIEDKVASLPTKTLLDDVQSMSPLDYERYCARILEDSGWTVQVTKATGDQGADIIAERGGTRLVVQCKKYAQPVGNKAVQEVFAAKKFQDADMAAVVSNATFTQSAKQLASKNGVLLLHHEDIASVFAEFDDDDLDSHSSRSETLKRSPLGQALRTHRRANPR